MLRARNLKTEICIDEIRKTGENMSWVQLKDRDLVHFLVDGKIENTFNRKTFLTNYFNNKLLEWIEIENNHKRILKSIPNKGPFTSYIDKILTIFDHLPPCIDIFYGINVDRKWTFLDHLPTLSCKRSLWTTPKLESYKFAKDILLFNGEATNLLKIRWLLSEKASAYSPHLWLLSSYLYLGRR